MSGALTVRNIVVAVLLAGLGVTAFACTPDAFPDLMAAAIERRDITQWAQRHQPYPETARDAGSASWR